MRQPAPLVCVAAAAASVAFTAVSDREFQVMASPNAAKSMNDVMVVSENSNTKKAEETFAPRFDGLQFIETLVTAHR